MHASSSAFILIRHNVAALRRFTRRQTDFMSSMLLFIVVRSFLLGGASLSPLCLERDCSGLTATGYVSPLLHYAYYTYIWRMSNDKFDNDVFLVHRILAFSLRDRV